MVLGACLRSDVIEQSNTLEHRRQVSGDVCYTYTAQGFLLLCLPHHSMYGDVTHDNNPVHPTPGEWRADGGRRHYSAVTHCILSVGFDAHP